VERGRRKKKKKTKVLALNIQSSDIGPLSGTKKWLERAFLFPKMVGLHTLASYC